MQNGQLPQTSKCWGRGNAESRGASKRLLPLAGTFRKALLGEMLYRFWAVSRNEQVENIVQTQALPFLPSV